VSGERAHEREEENEDEKQQQLMSLKRRECVEKSGTRDWVSEDN